MKLNYKDTSLTLGINEEDAVIISTDKINPYRLLTSNLGYRYKSLELSWLVITEKCLDEYYEPVDDFFALKFSNTLKKVIGYHEIYKSKKFDYFIELDKNLQQSYNGKEVYKKGFYKMMGLYYTTDNVSNAENTLKEINETCTINTNCSSKIYIVIKSLDGVTFKEHQIKPLKIDISTMYNTSFKPVHDKIVDKLTNTHKGVIMFHGEAGTGKTNYIKNLTELVPKKKFVFITTTMIPHLTDPSFMGKLIDHKGSILVLEDCENYLKDRNIDAGNNIVSTILNLSDGMLSDVLGVQIICTFNTNLENIDKALLRKGRLIAEYKFEKLESDKTKYLLKELGIDHKDNQEPMTLTDIFNANENNYKSQSEQAKIGF